MSRRSWPAIVEQAEQIVTSYDTPVTLRQLFYRLVSAQILPNTQSAYVQLSSRTAAARRDGGFPPLLDRGRSIHRPTHFDGVADALAAIRYAYRLDRTYGQDVSLYLGVEKAGLVNQLTAWFGDLGLPVLALGGYSSQTYVDDVRGDVRAYRTGGRLIAEYESWKDSPYWRPAVLLYAGDFDPSGEDIDRDFVERSGCFDKVERIALSRAQVDEFNLPPNPGKTTDSRARQFIERHGELMQVEIDAVDPLTLRGLFQTAIDTYWNDNAYRAVLVQERDDVARIDTAIGGVR